MFTKFKFACLRCGISSMPFGKAFLSTQSDKSTIIIGAGLGGLICAAYLAQAGIPVKVFEKQPTPGGVVNTFSRMQGKYNFEIAMHGTLAHGTWMEDILRNFDLFDKFDWVPVESFVFKDGDINIQYPLNDIEQYFKNLTHYFPDETDKIRLFIDQSRKAKDELKSLIKNGPPKNSFEKLSFMWKYPLLRKYGNMTMQKYKENYIKNEKLFEVLFSHWLYKGVPPSLQSAFSCMTYEMLLIDEALHYIKPRSTGLANELAQFITQNGGQIFYKTAVGKVLVNQNKVEGIQTKRGQVFQTNNVVCNGSAPTLFQEMLPEGSLPQDYLKSIAKYKVGLSVFILYLGLKEDITNRIKPHSICVTNGLSSDEIYELAKREEINEKTPFIFSIYDNVFKGYTTTPGHSTCSLLCPARYEDWKQFEDDYFKGRKDRYNEAKDKWTQILLKKVEEIIPGLSNMIEVCESASPLTFKRYTGNYEGSILGYETRMDNSMGKRIKNYTPIKGLYLAGQWGNPGGGISIVSLSGKITANLIKK
jgi:phytoene dehydrogenase-like protein